MRLSVEKIRHVASVTPWPGILLFAALLAQAPHAAWVFMRIAPPHELWWETGIAFVGAVVYAVALEGATAFFVWRDSRWLAGGFATFSFLHNVVYYMPESWHVDAWGATLSVRYILSAVLISASLPVAIAAFSHVQSGDKQTDKQPAKQHDTQDRTPAKRVVDAANQVIGANKRRRAILTHMQNGWGGAKAASEIVADVSAEFNTTASTIYRDLQKLESDGHIAKGDDGVVRLVGNGSAE